MAILILVGALAASEAIAEEPKPDTPAAAQADAKSSAADAAKDAAAAKRAQEMAKMKKFGAGGYKPETHNGTTYYCRSEAPMGSRLQQKTCRTFDQLVEASNSGKEYVQTIQQQGLAVPPKN